MNEKLLLMLFLSSVFLLNNVSAFGPHSHLWVDKIVGNLGSDTDVVKMCYDNKTNYQALIAGSLVNDITVVYYWVNGGKNYRLTHNWNFADSCMAAATDEDSKCLCYGSQLHLIADSISHTQMIPSKIELTKFPNLYAHPLLEKKIDSQIVGEHPELMAETRQMLDAFYGPNKVKYITIIQQSLGENIDFSIPEQIDNLNFALDAFYDKAFKPNVKDNSLFAIYPYIDSVTNFLHPIVGQYNIQDSNDYINKAAELSVSVFRSPGSRYSLSPHGFTELDAANKKAGWWVTGFFILLVSIFTLFPLFLVWRTRKFKWAFLMLLVIPVVILAVAIVYIIL